MRMFWKYHGLGNDFVLLDSLDTGELISADEARRLCDRHFGVGADGVLTLLPSQKGDCRMHITNADGSVPEMCGNGLRCLVKHVLDEGRFPGPGLKVETGRGLLACTAQRGSDGRVETVTVDMGVPVFERELIPMVGTGRFLDSAIELDGQRWQGSAVSMGNPHLILFGDARRETAERLGPGLQRHPWFPKRTNVNFAALRSRTEIDLVVYERGCGITLACGTGACATTSVAVALGLVDAEHDIRINLLGGSLFVRVAKDFSGVFMRGPATCVFRAEGTVTGGTP